MRIVLNLQTLVLSQRWYFADFSRYLAALAVLQVIENMSQ